MNLIQRPLALLRPYFVGGCLKYSICKNIIVYSMVSIFIILIASIMFKSAWDWNRIRKIDKPVSWLRPYLSGAANYEVFSGWRISLKDIENYTKLSDKEKNNYSFKKHEDGLSYYSYNDIGFMYIVILSKKVFFWLSDIKAIILFQTMIHIIISLIVISLLRDLLSKTIFFLFYAVNPGIIYFVLYPFYYFWQVIPSLVLVTFLIKKKHGNLQFIISFLFFLIFITRPATLFIEIFYFIVVFYRERSKKSIFGLAIFLGMILVFNLNFSKKNYEPWHTMYVGIGAYKNQYVDGLSDVTAFKYYYEKTGDKITTQPVTGSLHNTEVRKKYFEILKAKYLEILRNQTLLLFRNAILNFLESFSAGYRVGNITITYISAVIGLMNILVLLYSKQYIIFLAIVFSSLSFTLYYPPIQAYMYGSYILIVYGFIEIIKFFKMRYLLSHSIANESI